MATATTHYTAQWILPVGGPPLENGFIAVENGSIQAVGIISDLPESAQDALPRIKPGTLITPGLVNTHAHLEQSIGRQVPIRPGDRMADWLLALVKTFEGAFSEADRAAYVRRGIGEVIAAGTTCVNDISRDGLSMSLLDEAGLRGIVSLEFFHPDTESLQPDRLEPAIASYRQLADRYLDHDRLEPGLSPHSPYNVSPVAWREMLEQLGDSIPIHTHLAESPDERAFVRGNPGSVDELHYQLLKRTYQPASPAGSPVEYLDRHGLLTDRTMAAHAIDTSPADRNLLAAGGVGIAHCPRSNLFLHGKTLTWSDWRKVDITIGLGTDGHATTPDLDLRAEARRARAIHGWSARQALAAMTINGASVMGLSDRVGSLVPGKTADFVLWQAGDGIGGLSPEERLLAESTMVSEVYVAGCSILPPRFR